MRKKDSLVLLLFSFMLFAPFSGLPTAKAQGQASSTSQQKVIKGQVLEKATGEPLPGVTIQVLNSPRGVSTDVDGTFEIKAAPSESLVFSYLGMATQTIKIGNQTMITVKMEEQGNELEEFQVVAFGKQKKESVVGSITTVRAEDLRTPSSNLTTAFAGNIAGMIAYQRSGEPGADDADFFVRGITTFGANTSPLILIDNIELTSTDLAALRPDDIESFSILKDASATALYGSRAANGVILVTTKTGNEGPMQVFARLETSFSSPTQNVELADPVTYMTAHREAVSTRDPLGEQLYSLDKVENTGKPNANRYIYPANDWYDMMFKNTAINYRGDVNISGGGKVARYYVSAYFNKDTGLLKSNKLTGYNYNIDNNKYGVRTNIDINLTKTTKFAIKVAGNFQDYTGPLYSGDEIYTMVMHASPTLFAAYYPEDADHVGIKHIMYGNYDDGSYLNPYFEMTRGYRDYDRSQILASLKLEQDLNFITKGLNFTAFINLSRLSTWGVNRYVQPYYYALSDYDSYTGEYHVTRLNEDGTEYLTYNEDDKVVQNKMYFDTRLTYNREFDKHAVGGLLVMTASESKKANAGSLQKSLPSRNVTFAGRFTYGFDSRYFAEFNFGYNGSERFAKKHRWGFFPSYGAAWMISNEKFFKPLSKYIDKLKLRYSYGWTGNDNIGDENDRFYYLSQINMNVSGVASFGETGDVSGSGITISRYANDAITWERALKQNYAIEISTGGLEIIAEYYTEHRKDIFMSRADIPSTMGLQTGIYANIGEARSHGVDIQMEYRKVWNKNLWTSARGNFTFARGKYDVYEEPEYEEPWRSHVGQSIKQTWGYIAERLFIDDEEAENSPSQAAFGAEYGGGDIKYTDVNGDGVINESDRVPIGNPTSPEIIYGFGLSVGYKSFDCSVFFQGAANESFWIDAGSISPFNTYYKKYTGSSRLHVNNLLKAIADDHWSEDNRNAYAFWPRLSNTANANNIAVSTWWMRDGSFLRFKTFEFGYTVPKKALAKYHVQSLRLYVSGTNLFRWSNFDLWDNEKAGEGFTYPLQRTINVGLNITFK